MLEALQLLRGKSEEEVLPKPSACDDEAYNLMLDCWKFDPSARPTATDLVDWCKSKIQLHPLGEAQDYTAPAGYDWKPLEPASSPSVRLKEALKQQITDAKMFFMTFLIGQYFLPAGEFRNFAAEFAHIYLLCIHCFISEREILLSAFQSCESSETSSVDQYIEERRR